MTIIFNNCEHNNILIDILNDGDHVDDQDDYRFRSSFQKFLNMQLEILRFQRNIDNNDKQYDERYQINIIGGKESDERDQIGESGKKH